MEALTHAEVSQLGEAGWFMRERFLDEPQGRAAHAEALALVALGALTPAGMRRGHEVDSKVRSDTHAWLEPDSTRPALTVVSGLFEELRVTLNREAWLGLQSFELQLAHYGPGARYERHVDAFPGEDHRRITAIVYLNERWNQADGGLLRLHLATGVVDVPPTLGRLLVFRSARVEHEVLQSHQSRLAVTAWYRG